jgi:hypothetical protein
MVNSPVCILKGLLAFVTPRGSRIEIEAIKQSLSDLFLLPLTKHRRS